MPNETEKIHRKLQAELQVFCNLAKPQSEEEIKKVFDVILATVERVVELYDDEVTTIYQMAEDLFDEGDDRIQTMTFEFMKKLINVFERNVDHVAARSLTVSKFLAFYFSVVCRRSRQTKLCERAIDHAVRYCDYPQLYRKLAMQAFEPVWFLHYSLERFDKKTVKNLLSLTAAKLSCDPYTEGLIPGTLSFLSSVCDSHDTCGFCIRVCKVLQFLLQAPSFQVLVVLEGSGVLRWVLRHVSAFRAKRKCWEAIARFLTAAFLYADGETRQMLADLDLFMRVHEMFSDRRKSVLDELLELVRVASEARSGRWINHLLDFAVFLDVVSFVEHPQMGYTHRPKACRALNTFFANARIEQMVRGLDEGLTAWIVRLLKSKNESVLMDAMIWLFVAIDAISNRGLYTDLEDFIDLIRRMGGEQHLTRLCFHEKGFIRFAAAKLRERLEDTPSDMSCRALYARKSEQAAVIDSHPDPTLGLGAFLL